MENQENKQEYALAKTQNTPHLPAEVEQLIQISRDRELAELRYSADCIELTIDEAAGAYLNKKENYHTRIAHQNDLKQFKDYLLRNKIITLGNLAVIPAHQLKALCEGWLDSLLNQGLSKITVQRKKGTLRSFFRYLKQELPQLIKVVPVLDSEKHKEYYTKARTQSLTYDEWRDFRRVIERNPSTYRLSIMVQTAMMLGGRRIGEILSLRWDDIDFSRGSVSVLPSKKKSDTTRYILPLSPQLRKILLEYKEKISHTENKNTLVFPGETQQRIDSKMKYYARKAEITKTISFHSIRTSFITWANEQGHNQSEILNATLHSSPKMIRYYDQTEPMQVNSILKMML